MIVYWVAAIEFLFYLGAVPLHVAVCFCAGSGVHLGAGFSLFERRFADRIAFQKMQTSSLPKPDALKDAPSVKLLRLILRLIKHIRFNRIRMHGTFSTGDAAYTALVCGGIRSIECALKPFLPELSLDILPDFGSEKPHAELRGMISLRSGQIIYAALSGAAKNASRRITQWISIRLKAS